MAPICLNISLHNSRQNLRLSTIDLFYIHNAAEKQLEVLDKNEFLRRLKEAFVFLEEQIKLKYIRYYGMATWSCFTIDPKSDLIQAKSIFISLQEVVSIAESVGGINHGFRYIQLPVTLSMTGAFHTRNQDNELTILEKAQSLNITVMSSRSVGGAKFNVLSIVEETYTECVSSDIGKEYDKILTKSVVELNSRNSEHTYLLRQRAVVDHIQDGIISEDNKINRLPISSTALSLLITSSIPGVTTALVGMTNPHHVIENLQILSLPNIPSGFLLNCLFNKNTDKFPVLKNIHSDKLEHESKQKSVIKSERSGNKHIKYKSKKESGDLETMEGMEEPQEGAGKKGASVRRHRGKKNGKRGNKKNSNK